MLNRLGGQPESYEKKYESPITTFPEQSIYEACTDGLFNVCNRSKYRFGKTLGAGTYGVVREAEGPTGRVAVKIILKKNVKGNEQMVYDELRMLQTLKHPHIVRFIDWFESRVCRTPVVRARRVPIRKRLTGRA